MFLTFELSSCKVRKHRAPKGALRHVVDGSLPVILVHDVRKHRAPNGALRLDKGENPKTLPECRKAPSAKRCIKTRRVLGVQEVDFEVRKHQAPKGALRPVGVHGDTGDEIHVRKHRAPNGALRRHGVHPPGFTESRQKAPSAKRCIKTAVS